jgi:hypothetical protein
MVSGVLFAQNPQPNEALGTWKLNIAKSKWSPGPAPAALFSDLRRWEKRNDGFTVVTISGTDGNGNPTIQQMTYKIDGKDYPNYTTLSLAEFSATGAKPGTTTLKVVDEYTVAIQTKDAKGVPGIPILRSVSKDGKTVTMTTRGKNPQGVAVENILVYERVR